MRHPFTRTSKRRSGPGGISLRSPAEPDGATYSHSVPRSRAAPGSDWPQRGRRGGRRGCHRTAGPRRHRPGRPHSRHPAAGPARTYEFGLPAVRRLLGAPGAPGPQRALPAEPLVLPPAATRRRGRGAVTRPRRLHGRARARKGDGQGRALPAIGPRPGGPGRAGRLRLERLSWARPGRASRGEERG